MGPEVNIFWFRRDLRLSDNNGLYHALKAGLPVVPVFIFDQNILSTLEDPTDRRVEFIHRSLHSIQNALLKIGSTIDLRVGKPQQVFQQLVREYAVKNVFTNHDYEPFAIERDQQLALILERENIGFYTFKDQVIFEKSEIVKDDGRPYVVFTPYSRKWKQQLSLFPLQFYDSQKWLNNFHLQKERPIPTLESIGFQNGNNIFPKQSWEHEVIMNYSRLRDYPFLQGTSRLSVHLRFGTISIRQLVTDAAIYSETFLNELIWREFYQAILWHYPNVVHQSFKPEYDRIQWRNNEKEFVLWSKGETGYPIVDAGMRELNSTGFMHNRVRMIVASFMVKHLLIDWRWGEGYFAQKLLDYELASNNGGWQWAAGSGCDAAPYFRIFNPGIQAKKFDPERKYIKKWVPEFDTPAYNSPIINHDFARQRCLAVYRKALGNNSQ